MLSNSKKTIICTIYWLTNSTTNCPTNCSSSYVLLYICCVVGQLNVQLVVKFFVQSDEEYNMSICTVSYIINYITYSTTNSTTNCIKIYTSNVYIASLSNFKISFFLFLMSHFIQKHLY